MSSRLRSRPRRPSSRGAVASRVAVVAAAVILVVSTLYMTVAGDQVDWRTYQLAVERWLAGQPIYAAAQLNGPYHLENVVLSGYAYPPASVVLMLPFAFGDLGRILWLAVSVGVFVAGMIAVTSRYGGRFGQGLLVLLFLTLAAFGPYAEGVATGNATLILAGAFAFAVAFPGDWLGPAGALAAVTRVTPIFIVALDWRARHGLRRIAHAGLLGAGVILVTLPLIGLRNWHDYVTSITGAVPSCDQVVNSLTCALIPAVGLGAAKVTAIAATFVCVGAAILIHRRIVAACLLSVAMLLPLPDLWPFYLLFPFVALWAALATCIGGLSRAKTPRSGSTVTRIGDVMVRATSSDP